MGITSVSPEERKRRRESASNFLGIPTAPGQNLLANPGPMFDPGAFSQNLAQAFQFLQPSTGFGAQAEAALGPPKTSQKVQGIRDEAADILSNVPTPATGQPVPQPDFRTPHERFMAETEANRPIILDIEEGISNFLSGSKRGLDIAMENVFGNGTPEEAEAFPAPAPPGVESVPFIDLSALGAPSAKQKVSVSGQGGTRGAAISPVDVPPLAATDSPISAQTEGFTRDQLAAQLEALLPADAKVPDKIGSALAGAGAALSQRRRGLGAALLAAGTGSQAGLQRREAQIVANADAKRRALRDNLSALLRFDEGQREAAFDREQLAQKGRMQDKELKVQAALAAQKIVADMERAKFTASVANSRGGGISPALLLKTMVSQKANVNSPSHLVAAVEQIPQGAALLAAVGEEAGIPYGGSLELTRAQKSLLLENVVQTEGGAALLREAQQLVHLRSLQEAMNVTGVAGEE